MAWPIFQLPRWVNTAKSILLNFFQTRIGKGLWGLVVLMCFLSSSVLIYESYVDFQNSPVVTSITTHHIKDLDFPTVTVCPPKDSNTALNYDLMRARNMTLIKEQRETSIRSSTLCHSMKSTSGLWRLPPTSAI